MKIRTIIIIALFVVLASTIGVLATLPGIGNREPYVEPEPHFHSFGEWAPAIEATCTEGGTQERKCTGCDERKVRMTPPNGHILGDWVLNAEGDHIKICRECDETVAVSENYTETSEGLLFGITFDRKNYMLMGIGECQDSVIVVPSEVNGFKVTEICAGAFRNCNKLDTLILPDTMKTIGKNAFMLSSLRRIYIPDGVTSIGESAFSECEKLESVILPNSLESISPFLFNECTNLSEIYLPENAGSIPEKAFYNCGVTFITLPKNATSIAKHAFSHCKQLRHVKISEGLTSIETGAFETGEALEVIYLPESATEIGEWVFAWCTSLRQATLSTAMTSIPNYTFNGCESLESVDIPEEVRSLGTSCFAGCRSLTEIDLPDGLTGWEFGIFSGCSSLKSIVIPEKISQIDTMTFAYCTSLESIYIPASVRTISATAFIHTGDNLTNIEVSPDNDWFSSDGKTLFSYKRVFLGAADGSIPTDVTKILSCAFYGREKLSEIFIPKNIVEIESSAFNLCPNVKSITYEGTVAEWEKVSLGTQWFTGADIKVVHCSDGDAELEIELYPSMW